MSDNWGVKYDVHVYVEGEPPSQDIFDACADLLALLESRGHKVDFVGVSKRHQFERPKDQGAT